jgi:hypothetical protein
LALIHDLNACICCYKKIPVFAPRVNGADEDKMTVGGTMLVKVAWSVMDD